MLDLPFFVERAVTIRAQRNTVFRYFTDSERFARWWGKGSTIEAKEGGRVSICYPDGSTASGHVLQVHAEEQIVLTFGYDDPQKPIPPGGSRLVMSLADVEGGTALQLRHEVPSAAIRDLHVMGWRYHLAVLAHAATQEQHQNAEAMIDRWFTLWTEKDPAQRVQILAEIASRDVTFRDPWGCVSGRDELTQHIGAVQMHMPARPERRGAVRQAQGTAVVEWVALAGDREVMRGVNVFALAADGTIAGVVGIAG
jgi:uncharacterized protein YndB with AHSA1/START domain